MSYKLTHIIQEKRLPNHGSEGRSDRIREFITLNGNINVAGIPEGNLLRVEGDIVNMIGSGEMKVFSKDHEIRTYTSADSLNFLMN